MIDAATHKHIKKCIGGVMSDNPGQSIESMEDLIYELDSLRLKYPANTTLHSVYTMAEEIQEKIHLYSEGGRVEIDDAELSSISTGLQRIVTILEKL